MKYIALFALIGLVALANASTPFDLIDGQQNPFPYRADLPLSLRVKNPTVGTVVTLSDTDGASGFEVKFTLTTATTAVVSFGGTSLTAQDQLPAGSTDFIVVYDITPAPNNQVSFGATVYPNTGAPITLVSNDNQASSSALVGDVKLEVTGSANRVTVYPSPFVLSQSEASAIFGASGDCFDFVQNNMETAVDCGGSLGCTACTCSDNVQNQGEFGTDCGFPCFGQCSGILDVPFDKFEGGVTSGVQSFTGTPKWDPSLAAPMAGGEPATRYGVMTLEGDGNDEQAIGTLIPVTFAPSFTVRIISSFGSTMPPEKLTLLNCGANLFVYVDGEHLKADLRGVTRTLVGLPSGVGLGGDWSDIFVVVTPTTISGQTHFGLGDPVSFSALIDSATPAPTDPVACTIGNTDLLFGTYYDRVTIYNGLALSSAQQNDMYDFPPALGHCADGIKNGDETGVDCGSGCSRVCPTDNGGNGGGNNGNTCPSCAAGTNLQVIPSSGIRGGEYGLVSTSGTCITVRVHA